MGGGYGESSIQEEYFNGHPVTGDGFKRFSLDVHTLLMNCFNLTLFLKYFFPTIMATEDGFINLTVFSLELIMTVDMQWKITIFKSDIPLRIVLFPRSCQFFGGVWSR